MTILWAVNDRDGKALPLKDKEVHLYYTCERGRFEADIEIQDNVVAWHFLGSAQRVLGGYTLTLEVLQSNGKRVIRRDICDVFTLVGKWCEENHNKEDGEINKGGEINLVSELEIYRISPIIPIIGENGNWWIDGQDTGDPSTGKTAYEYAQTKGYTGTEEEFAALMAKVPNLSTRVENVETEIRTLEEGVIQDLGFSKQEKLVSGQNIKTINGQSVLGSGNIKIEVKDNVYVTDFTVNDLEYIHDNPYGAIQFYIRRLYDAFASHKVVLVPYGDGSAGYGIATGYQDDFLYVSIMLEDGRRISLEIPNIDDNAIYPENIYIQTLVSDGSLKTINGQSIIGSGNINIKAADNVYVTSFTVRDLNDLLNNPGRDIQIDSQGLYEAIHERKIILVPNGEFPGYGIAVGYIEDLIYLTVYLEGGRQISLDLTIGNDTIYSNEVTDRYVVYTKSFKTINGESILGSGDITVKKGPEIVVDKEISRVSENPVQNKTIAAELDKKQATISDLSTIRRGASLGATALQTHQDISHLAEKTDVESLAKEVFTNTNMNLNQGGQIAVLFDSKAEKSELSELDEKVETLAGTGEGSVIDIVTTEIAKVISSAPEDLDTLREIAEFIEADATRATEIITKLDDHESRISKLEDEPECIVMSEREYNLLPNKEEKLYFLYEE